MTKFKPSNVIGVFDEMNFIRENQKFKVYIHTSPHGKKYVGITSQRPEKRWGNNGSGYVDNKHFYSAIQLYGWDNFKHEIVAENLNLVQASNLESALIAEYNTIDSNHGYNQTTGGNWSKPSAEVRKKLSIATTTRWKNPEYKVKVVPRMKQALVGRKLSEEHKQHIKDFWKTHEHPLKGKPVPEDTRKKLSAANKGKPSWNKGYTKETHPSLMSTSKSLKNRQFSDTTKKQMSDSRLALYANGYEPHWINDGAQEKQITDVDAIPAGFVLGRLPSVYVTNDTITKKIAPQELSQYLNLGWTQGKDSKTNECIKKSKQQYIWEYDGQEFTSSSDLAKYLNLHGYPKIVASTITCLYIKGFRNSKQYASLDGKIIRKDINEN